jgi:ABC-type cobalamin/Fe3+-siderophores transport system ATPase subunit
MPQPDTSKHPALVVETMEAGYEPGLPIVRGACLTVQAGEIVAILWPNGAGKSTLVKAVVGLVPVSSGRTLLFGQDITRVAGIDPERVLRATWIIGGMLAAVAGVFAGITVQLRPTLGVDLLLPLFAAVILGGIGSVWGAVLGGFIVGLAESASVSIVGAEYRAAAAFAVLILILMVRPTGLFPEKH